MLAFICYVCISDFLCISTTVLIVAYVNLILKKMMIMMMMMFTVPLSPVLARKVDGRLFVDFDFDASVDEP